MLLLKVPAALIGAVLTLGGFGAFLWSLWTFLGYLIYHPGGPRLAGSVASPRPELSTAIGLFVGAVLAIAAGTQLGRFARGDFD